MIKFIAIFCLSVIGAQSLAATPKMCPEAFKVNLRGAQVINVRGTAVSKWANSKHTKKLAGVQETEFHQTSSCSYLSSDGNFHGNIAETDGMVSLMIYHQDLTAIQTPFFEPPAFREEMVVTLVLNDDYTVLEDAKINEYHAYYECHFEENCQNQFVSGLNRITKFLGKEGSVAFRFAGDSDWMALLSFPDYESRLMDHERGQIEGPIEP